MTNSSVHFHNFENRVALIEMLSQNIAKNLQNAINKNGQASLIVSGGSTPKPLFEKLRQSKIAWEEVTIGLCDERWVNPSHDDSNEKFVKTYLLQEEASRAKFVGMYIDKTGAKEAEIACEERMKKYLYPFDVLILGMGSDAHTASLFPQNVKLKDAFDLNSNKLCIQVEPKSAPHMRMSLTLPAILSSNHLYLHFEGDEKFTIYQEAMSGGDVYTMPIRSILHQDQKDIEVYYT